jgi:hypothetical protein
MTAFSRLPLERRKAILDGLMVRKQRYISALNREPLKAKVIIVGDRPGPAAPTDPDYHHTPFYSIKHCSGWLNALLQERDISENDLLWLNAADRLGNPTDPRILKDNVSLLGLHIISLGGNAQRWLAKDCKQGSEMIYHPQYWKRFRNKEPYPLIDRLAEIID